jgi:hypothetical protein
VSKRKENERAYPDWEELPGGVRRYWREQAGGDFGWCRYVKTVDSREITIRFVQEIYNDDGILIEVHQKYPIDTGHQYLADEE